MRDIKFRVWHKKRKKYYELHHLHLDTIGIPDNPKEWATCKAYDCIENKEIYIQVQPKEGILEQYTGLKDKNGVEIYEGDKIVWYDDISDIDIIEWIDKEGCWGTQSTLWLCNTNFRGNIEVIGNTHEDGK